MRKEKFSHISVKFLMESSSKITFNVMNGDVSNVPTFLLVSQKFVRTINSWTQQAEKEVLVMCF